MIKQPWEVVKPPVKKEVIEMNDWEQEERFEQGVYDDVSTIIKIRHNRLLEVTYPSWEKEVFDDVELEGEL